MPCDCSDCRRERETAANIQAARTEVASCIIVTVPTTFPKVPRAKRRKLRASGRGSVWMQEQAQAYAAAVKRFNVLSYCGRSRAYPAEEGSYNWPVTVDMSDMCHTILEASRCGFSMADGACNCYRCCGYRGSLTTWEEWYLAAVDAATSPRVRSSGRAIMAESRSNRARRMPVYIGSQKETRTAGVEIEFADDDGTFDPDNDGPVAEWRDSWDGAAIHEDGSCGWEAVTPPASGRMLASVLRSATDAIINEGATIDHRCSCHVHIDAADLRWPDVFTLMKLWAKVEPAMFLLAGQGRMMNQYCPPAAGMFQAILGASDRKGATLAAYVQGNVRHPGDYAEDARANVASGGIYKKGSGRYRAVNLLPWLAGRAFRTQDTTIEFRLHKASLSHRRLTSWSNLLTDIVSWCRTHGEEAVGGLHRDPFRALMLISKRSAKFILDSVRGYRRHTRANPSTLDGKRSSLTIGRLAPLRAIVFGNGKVTVARDRIDADYYENYGIDAA